MSDTAMGRDTLQIQLELCCGDIDRRAREDAAKMILVHDAALREELKSESAGKKLFSREMERCLDCLCHAADLPRHETGYEQVATFILKLREELAQVKAERDEALQMVNREIDEHMKFVAWAEKRIAELEGRS